MAQKGVSKAISVPKRTSHAYAGLNACAINGFGMWCGRLYDTFLRVSFLLAAMMAYILRGNLVASAIGTIIETRGRSRSFGA